MWHASNCCSSARVDKVECCIAAWQGCDCDLDPTCAAAAGVLAVKRVNGVPIVFPADSGEVAPEENLLQVGGAWADGLMAPPHPTAAVICLAHLMQHTPAAAHVLMLLPHPQPLSHAFMLLMAGVAYCCVLHPIKKTCCGLHHSAADTCNLPAPATGGVRLRPSGRAQVGGL